MVHCVVFGWINIKWKWEEIKFNLLQEGYRELYLYSMIYDIKDNCLDCNSEFPVKIGKGLDL